jgi:hypothetical protein
MARFKIRGTYGACAFLILPDYKYDTPPECEKRITSEEYCVCRKLS